LGSGTVSTIRSLTVYSNKLIAGGYFTTIGGNPANYIAQWDGANWSALGSGTGNRVYSLTVYDGKLIAGGNFTTAGGNPAVRIAQWDGANWSALSSGMGNTVLSLIVYNSELIAGGNFITAGGHPALYAAKWSEGGVAPTNDSLDFTNPDGGSGNKAVADNSTEWNFQAKVSDTDGVADINYVEMRFANAPDHTLPYDSLKFRWTRSSDTFYKVIDTQVAAEIISTSADSSSAGNQWTLNFKIKFNNNFLAKDTNYNLELYSIDNSSLSDNDDYPNLYQVNAPPAGVCDNFDHLTLAPSTVSLTPGETQSFTAKAINDSDGEMSGVTFNWSATGGTIGGSGNYVASSQTGTYTVSITSSCGGSTSSTVTVSTSPAPTCPESCLTIDNYCTGQCSALCSSPQSQTIVEKPSYNNVYYLNDQMQVRWHYSAFPSFLHHYLPSRSYIVLFQVSTDQGKTYLINKWLIPTFFKDDPNYSYAKIKAFIDQLQEINHLPSPSLDYYDDSHLTYPNFDYAQYLWQIPQSSNLISSRAIVTISPVPFAVCYGFDKGNSARFSIQKRSAQLFLHIIPDDVSVKKGSSYDFIAQATNEYGEDVTNTTSFTWKNRTASALNLITSSVFQSTARAVTNNKTGHFENEIKVTAKRNNLTTFAYASIYIVNDVPYLAGVFVEPYVKVHYKGEPGTYTAIPLDQYHVRYPRAEISWELTDSRAGTIEADSSNDEKAIFTAGQIAGCYPWLIKATAQDEGRSFYNFAAVNIKDQGYDPANDPTTRSDVRLKEIMFSPFQNAFHPHDVIASSIFVKDTASRQWTVSNNTASSNKLPGLNVTVSYLNPNIGNLAFNGDRSFLEVSSNIGNYNPAFTIRATYNDQVIETSKKFQITSEDFRYDHFILQARQSYEEQPEGGQNAKKYYVKPAGYLSFTGWPVDQFGSLLKTASWSMELGQEAGKLERNSSNLLIATNNKGTYQNAIKVNIYDNKTKQRYAQYADLVVTDDTSLVSWCLIKPCPTCSPCDPKDPNCRRQRKIIKLIPRIDALLSIMSMILALLTALFLLIGRILPYLFALLNLLLFLKENLYQWLGLRRRKKSWGVIFDDVTKKPLAFVRLQLYSWPGKRLKETTVSNKLGEFGFLVPAGKYYLKAYLLGYNQVTIKNEKLGDSYIFNRSDSYYSNIYYSGEIIKIESSEQDREVLNISLPMKPKDKISIGERLALSFNAVSKKIDKIRLPLLVFGTILAILTLILRHNWIDWYIFVLYLVLWIWELYWRFYRVKPYGKVLDSETEKPLDLAMLRLINTKTKKIIAVSVTGTDGRFVFAASPGNYQLTAVKAEYQPITIKPIHLKSLRQLGEIKINMKKVGG